MILYSHPAFIDINMMVRTMFKIPTKDIIELKVLWVHKRHGYVIAEEKIRMTQAKWSEFQRINV